MSRADFSSIPSGRSRRYLGAYFSLAVSPLASIGAASMPKCACVVSKKAAASAVDRNLIKRRCREACRLAVKAAAAPCSLVFYAKKEAKGASYAEIEKDIRKLMSQAR